MRIVTAGVHHRHILTLIGRARLARPRQAGLFLERQRVHVGADEDRRPRTIAEHADDAGAANLLGHGETGLAQTRREDAGGAHLLHPEFGVGVQILVKRFERRIVPVEHRVQTLADDRKIRRGSSRNGVIGRLYGERPRRRHRCRHP